MRNQLCWLAAAAALAALPASAAAQTRSLTLGEAARLAAEQNAEALAARQRASQQEARVTQARADLLPSLSTDALIDGGTDTPVPGALSGGAGYTPGVDRTFDMRVRLSQKLVDLSSLGRWRAASAQADAAQEAARYGADRSAQAGALAYVAVLEAEARLQARIADSVLAEELLDIARQHLAAGTAIALDVTRAESQLASATSQLIKGRNQRARAELYLLQVLGLPVATRIGLADSLALPAEGDGVASEAEAVRDALLQRGDVHAAEAATVSAQRSVGATRMERLPTVSAFAQAASNSRGTLDGHSYGVQISLPLFDGLRREARVQEARARQQEAETRYDDARRRTEVEVRSAMLDLAAAREQVDAARVQLELAEREVSQARERFTSGVAGNADVIDAQLSLNGARDVAIDALTAYHAARVGLAGARGVTTALP